MRRHRVWGGAIASFLALALTAEARAARVKDLVDVQGWRANSLVGLGIVVGLQGTGDDANSFLARRPLATIMKNLGSAIDPVDVRARNVAMVMVTAELPAFARSGLSLPVTVSSIGTARSLLGGTLIATALKGLDRQTYAVAQGALLVGGYDVQALSGSRHQKNHATVGRVPDGAIVERDAPTVLAEGQLVLVLKQPDFTTATRIKAAIDKELGGVAATIRDPGAIVLTSSVAPGQTTMELVARLEALEATPDAPARVVIDERSGSIVVGATVTLGPAAIAYGGITIRVREGFLVSQPNPLASGDTAIVPRSEIDVDEPPAQLHSVTGAATVGEVAAALNGLGVRPRDLVPIFQALKAAGALVAEIQVL